MNPTHEQKATLTLPRTGQRLHLRTLAYHNLTDLEYITERADIDRRLQSPDVITRHEAFFDDKALKRYEANHAKRFKNKTIGA